MRKIFIILFLLATTLPSVIAQTYLSNYIPGVTSDGAIYFLPKTAINVTIQVEKTTYTPGDLCIYSERYLRVKDVPTEPSVNYRIIAFHEQAVAVADTTKGYAITFNPKSAATNVRLSDDGILLAINADPLPQQFDNDVPQHTGIIMQLPNPRQYMSAEILAAGSTAKMAQLTAQDIYDIRESRNLLVRGQADNMPKDGEQLRLMLNQLELQNLSLTSLFTGVQTKDTTEYSFTIIPDEPIKQKILFRFSKRLGLVDADDLAGEPYYINVEDLMTVAKAETADPKKKGKKVEGVYVNIPGRLRATLTNSQFQSVLSEDFPAGQFGNVELLSDALFNKRYTTHLWINPLSGAVERLDAEIPK